MATLVLTVAGSIIGGPVGGAIGAAIGQQIDQRLFAPKGARGPRLGDLSVQVSRYGQQIPKLFGTMRIAGTVIWATDLIESRHRSGGGKGKPKTTTYSYSASLAVALSARPIRAVHRIWADGKLLRGAGGDWKAQAGFRLYSGGEDQPVDPLIAAAEGSEQSPAYRGLAYAVFEHLDLGDFGNHIPSLTFEVEADPAPVSLGRVAEELSGGTIAQNAPFALDGFAAMGDSVRGAIDGLARVTGAAIADDGTALRFADPGAAPITIDEQMLGARAEQEKPPRTQTERLGAGVLPDQISVSYYDAARDYQSGLQRATRNGPGRRTEEIDLPAVIAADAAKGFAEQRLAAAWRERTRRTVRLPWRMLGLEPGDMISLPDESARWRIGKLSFEKMVLEATLIGTSARAVTVAPASPGRAIDAGDLVQGATTLHLFDLPPLDDIPASAPRLWVAAAGISPGWRQAALSLSLDNGASYVDIGGTAAPATMGAASGALGDGSALLFDDINIIDIELLNDAMSLHGRSDDALMNGANAALLGDEIIQFGIAAQIGPRHYRLSRLLRGRRGTEWAMMSHVAGERFILLEEPSLLAYDLPIGAIGGEARLLASGIGDAGAASAVCPIVGRNVRPPMPVKLGAERLADGTIRFSWVRRSRIGWAWLSEGDAPLGEESERYRIAITPSSGTARSAEIAQTWFDYAPAAQIADGTASTSNFTVSVAQLGSLAASLPPATANVVV